MKQLLASLFAALCLLALPQAAIADVWGYIDARGVAHFANERLDERYELFFRGGQTFDTANGVRAEYPSPVALPGTQGKLLTYFDVSPSFKAVRHHIREASTANQIDFELIQALIATESGFDVAAVSPKGAVGLMQLMPATAQRYGVGADKNTPIEKKLTDPRTNIRAGSRYLGDLIKMFPGRLELALAAYNAGEGAVQRAGNRIPNYKETQNYVKTVMQLYTLLKPVNVADPRRAPARVQMELRGAVPVVPVVPVGGAVGRGNMITQLLPGTPIAAVSAQPGFRSESD